jgi:TolA-binding protein
MRFHLIGFVLLASIAMPAAAQRAETIDRRVDRLEQELRAVQRRVFPDANGPVIAPEIGAAATPARPAGVPATSPVADLDARLDALEASLRSLTGQVEQNSNRLRLFEEQLARLRETTGARLDALERAASAISAAAAAPASPERPAATPQPAGASRGSPSVAERSGAGSGDAEAAYNAGFHLWERKRYKEAAQTLERVAHEHPDSRWASWAANLAGRSYLDSGLPAKAAKAFLANYQNDKKGERAPDSLYYLGQALVALNKPAEACKAYDELRDVYGRTVRESLKQQVAAARAEARCDR